MKELEHTANVPNIAPLAPTEGKPTREKLPPRMFLQNNQSMSKHTHSLKTYPKIPAAK